MPKKTGKSSLSGSLKKHSTDETRTRADFTNLPAGITDGVAVLTAATLGQYKEGTAMAGQPFIRLAGTVVEPKTHVATPKAFIDGKVQITDTKEMKVQGLQTSQMLPLCDTKTRAGKVTSEDENVDRALNELRLLGVDTTEIEDEESLEAVLEALQGAGVHFKFKTSGSDPNANFPEERVWENWYGAIEDYESDDSGDDIEDDTEDEEESDNSDDAEEESEDESEEESSDSEDLSSLAEAADEGDEEAAAKLEDLAKEAGISEEAIEGVESWADVVEMIDNGGKSESESDDGWVPEKGDIYDYKGKGKRTATPHEVTAVFEGKKTVNLKNSETGASVRGIAWDDLQEAD